MSVAQKQKRSRSAGGSQAGDAPRAARPAWSPSDFQITDDSVDTIIIADDDPMQSLTQAVNDHRAASATVGSQLDAELDRLGDLARQLQQQVAGPIETAAPATAPRTSAREAWSAVVILILFIVAGFAWTSSQMTAKDRQAATLTRAVEEKQTAILSYQQQIKQLRADLAQSQAKLKAAERRLKAQAEAQRR